MPAKRRSSTASDTDTDTDTDEFLLPSGPPTRISEIHAVACQVFGDATKASIWLTSENHALNDVPFRLLNSDAGAERVRQELRRIELGGVA